MLQDFSSKLSDIKSIINGKSFKTLIASGPNRKDFSYGSYKKPNFLALENAYTDYSVFASINLLAEAAYGEGFSLEGTNKTALEICNPIQELKSFKPITVDGIKDDMIFGLGAMENLWEDKTITGFKTIDMKTLEDGIFWDSKGNITSYKQKTQTDSVPLEVDDVTLFRSFRKGDNIYGIGLIEPVFGLMEIRKDMFIAIRDIFKFLAMPPVHIVKKGATKKSQLIAADKQWKGFHRKKYFITGEGWEINMLEVKRALPDLSKYFEIVDSAISIGLRVPTKVLSGDMSYATKASALALREYSKDEIKYRRNKMSRILEQQIFLPLCLKNGIPAKEIPKVIWNPDPPADPSVLNEILIKQIETLTKLSENELLEKSVAKEKITGLVNQMAGLNI